MSDDFLPWWLGGLAIGAIATLYPLMSGRLLGVSSLYASLFVRNQQPKLSELEAALLAETEAEFGPSVGSEEEPLSGGGLARWRLEGERWRPLFLLGMPIGAALVALSNGVFEPSWSLGERFDLRYGEFGVLPAAVLVASGVLIGFGTRLAAGCTSGHGISGVARAQPGSLVSTTVFWVIAVLVSWTFTLL